MKAENEEGTTKNPKHTKKEGGANLADVRALGFPGNPG
jgi:hypothetical protein